jgi:hypothetical protein
MQVKNVSISRQLRSLDQVAISVKPAQILPQTGTRDSPQLKRANQSSTPSGHTNSSQHHRLSYEGRVRSARTFPEAADDGERRGGGGRGRWRGRRRRAVALRRGRLGRRGVHRRSSRGSGHLDLAGSGGSATTRGRAVRMCDLLCEVGFLRVQ